MEVYLIRHTETILDKDVCYGQSDVSLKEPFYGELIRINKGINIDDAIIYTSPLSRCKILAENIKSQKRIKHKLIVDDRLKELDFGNWEFKRWNEIDRTQLTSWMNNFVLGFVPGGESFTELYNRVNDFIEMMLFNDQSKRPSIIVTHAGVIRCFLCREQNIPLEHTFSFIINFGSITKINIDNDSKSIFL